STRDSVFEIYLMDADGSNPRRLTDDPADDVEPAWLADGSRIIFCSTRSGEADIWSMNPDGTDPVNLTDDPSTFDCAPEVTTSPGIPGRISFVSDRANGNLSIYTMDPDGSNVFRVTNDPSDDFDSSFSGDGSTLAFDSNRNGNWDIYTIEEDGTNLRQLTDHEADEWNPVWKP
ncbi:MAG: TolB family protein, partial [Gemmatimonadota bacterium]